MKRWIDFINKKRFEHLIKSVRFKDSIEYMSYDVRPIGDIKLFSFFLIQQGWVYAYSSFFTVEIHYYKNNSEYISRIYFNEKGKITGDSCSKDKNKTKPIYKDIFLVAKKILPLSKSNRTMIYDDKVVELGK